MRWIFSSSLAAFAFALLLLCSQLFATPQLLAVDSSSSFARSVGARGRPLLCTKAFTDVRSSSAGE